MNFPKKIMKTSELKSLGFSDFTLRELRSTRGQTFAYKIGANGNVLWDTDRLQRFLDRNLFDERKTG